MVFQCINICQVPLEVLKTAAFGLGFQHLARDWRMLMYEKPCLIPILGFWLFKNHKLWSLKTFHYMITVQIVKDSVSLSLGIGCLCVVSVIWLFMCCMCHIFLAHLSSAQDELLWSLFVRRPSVRPCVRPSVRPLTFSNDFSSEAAEPILLKFHMKPP